MEQLHNKHNKKVEETDSTKDIETGRASTTSRRGFLAGAGATLASLVLGDEPEANESVPEPAEWADIVPDPVNSKEQGSLVLVDDIMRQSIPVPDPEQILGADTGLIISKRFHRFWLFKDGKLLRTGPVGTAMTSAGLSTPEGKFNITRQEGEDYSSREFPASDPEKPNMAWASFFESRRGIAFHGSPNFRTFTNPDTKVQKTYLYLDSSHGCVNALKSDADLVQQTLGIGSTVVVLP